MLSPRLSPAGFAHDTREERDFFQARLSSFYRIAFVLSGAGFVAALLVFVATGTTSAIEKSLAPQAWVIGWASELFAVATCFALWRFTRRGLRSPTVLSAIDIAGTMLLSFSYVGLGVTAPPYLRPESFQLIMVTIVLSFRAVIVPSSAMRTLTLGVITTGAIVLFAFEYYSHHYVAEGAPPPVVYTSFAALLGAGSVAVSTITSHTLFGLRQKVREATQLGQYTLTEKIGEGGMGIVYKAQHAMLCRPTAIKLLPADKAGGQGVARFEREVQLTSMLTHPNTVQIYDFGRTPEGTFYYAMEYLDGLTLDALIALDGPQPPSRVIALLAQVCGSLAEAHAIGLIHRDIKPENIMVCERGRLADVVKVVDFGLVKALEGPDVAKLSRTGALAGTPLYMAPEAILTPDRIDARSDLYALGAVGYFLVTGRNVFEGKTLVEIGAHHLYTPPEPPSKRLGAPLPPDFEAVLLACLAKTPAERPRDADALRARLLACADGHAWTDEQSRTWWDSHRDRIHDHRARQVPKSGTFDVGESGQQKRVGRAR